MDPVKAEYRLDSSSEAPSNMVVLTVPAYTNREVDDLPQIFHTVNPDALNSVVNSMDEGHVSFSYAGHWVKVSASSEVSLVPLDG